MRELNPVRSRGVGTDGQRAAPARLSPRPVPLVLGDTAPHQYPGGYPRCIDPICKSAVSADVNGARQARALIIVDAPEWYSSAQTPYRYSSRNTQRGVRIHGYANDGSTFFLG